MKTSKEFEPNMTSRSKRFRSPLSLLILVLAIGALPAACKGGNTSPSDEDDDNGDDVVNPGGDRNDDGAGGSSTGKTGGRGNAGGSSNGTTGGRGPGSGGQGGDLGGDGNTGGAEATGGNGGGSGGGFVKPPVPNCDEEPNGEECWDLTECNGVSTIQFLEQCGGVCQAGFDNLTRIEGFTGTLPPLQ